MEIASLPIFVRENRIEMIRKTNDASHLITQGAVIAALYVCLTMLANAAGLAGMAIQLRFSEALTILPVFTAAAIPGLFIGCLISNLLMGALPLDVVFGSLATLAGAVGTYGLRKHRNLAWLPPVLANTLVVPPLLAYVYQIPGSIWYFALTVGAGELISCGILGTALLKALEKRKQDMSW